MKNVPKDIKDYESQKELNALKYVYIYLNVYTYMYMYVYIFSEICLQETQSILWSEKKKTLL